MNSAESPTSAPGAVLLGKYRVDRVIGQGGMGFVVEATHMALGHRVAVKVLHAARRQDGEHLARFHREAELIARIQSDHVVRLLDVGVSDLGEPFIVMELLEGRTFGEEIAARGPLPVTEAVDLMLQAVRGVADAHAVGLVHRDIKPANLFVARRGSRPGGPPSDAPAVVKVLDFGLSKGPDSGKAPLTSTDATFGTPQYMSPEQLRSAKYVDARTDQHALACVLYEALTARPAFDATSLTALVMMINTEIPTPPSRLRGGISPALDAVIANAMAKDAKARFADLGAFAAALAPFGGTTAHDVAAGVAKALARAAGAPDTMPRASGDELVAAPPAGSLSPSPTRAPSQVNPHAADFTPGHLPTGGMPAASEAGRRVNSDAMTRQLGAAPTPVMAVHPKPAAAAAAAPPSTRVKGWSDVLPVDVPSTGARAARAGAAAPGPPVSRADGGQLRPTPTPVSRKTGGLLQGKVVIAIAAIVSILGIWLVVSLVRKVDTQAAGAAQGTVAASGASSVTVVAEDPEEDPAASTEPVVAPGTSAPSASASASASAPKAAPTQTSRRRKRRRH